MVARPLNTRDGNRATTTLPITDRNEKTTEFRAPVSCVRRAVTDHQEFGRWFRVRLEGPFVPDQVSHGGSPIRLRARWGANTQKMEPEWLFSFTWDPYAVDPKQDWRAADAHRVYAGVDCEPARCCVSSSPDSTSSRADAERKHFG